MSGGTVVQGDRCKEDKCWGALVRGTDVTTPLTLFSCTKMPCDLKVQNHISPVPAVSKGPLQLYNISRDSRETRPALHRVQVQPWSFNGPCTDLTKDLMFF